MQEAAEATAGFSGRELAKMISSIQTAVYGSAQPVLTPALFRSVVARKVSRAGSSFVGGFVALHADRLLKLANCRRVRSPALYLPVLPLSGSLSAPSVIPRDLLHRWRSMHSGRRLWRATTKRCRPAARGRRAALRSERQQLQQRCCDALEQGWPHVAMIAPRSLMCAA